MAARRVPVREDFGDEPGGVGRTPAGSVEWWEHEAAWAARCRGRWFRPRETAEQIAAAGGLTLRDLMWLLGHEPVTWVQS